MSELDNNVDGLTGASLPPWLAEWLLSQQPPQPTTNTQSGLLTPQRLAPLTTYSNDDISEGSGDSTLLGGSNKDNLDFNITGRDVLDTAVDLAPIPTIAKNLVTVGGYVYDEYGNQISSSLNSDKSLGSSIVDGAKDLYNSAVKEVNNFTGTSLAQHTNNIGGLLGFDMINSEETLRSLENNLNDYDQGYRFNDSFGNSYRTSEDREKAQERYDTVRSNYSPLSETGEGAKNIGAMFDNLTPIIGPFGLLGQGVAGLFEIGELDDVLSSMDLQELDWGDIFKAAFTGATLRSEADDNIYDALEKDGGSLIEQSSWYNNAPKGWDTDAKGPWEYTASDTLDSLYGNRNPLESLEIPFDFKNMTTPEFVEWDNQKQKEKIAKNERGLFSNISPAFQVTPEQFRSPEGYDTRLNTITTIDQAHQFWNTKALIEAEEEEARLGDTFEWSAGDGSAGSNESSGADAGLTGQGNDGGGQDDYD